MFKYIISWYNYLGYSNTRLLVIRGLLLEDINTKDGILRYSVYPKFELEKIQYEIDRRGL